jgi:tripartite-type tricarboxylate transporter receptor subunit TctC
MVCFHYGCGTVNPKVLTMQRKPRTVAILLAFVCLTSGAGLAQDQYPSRMIKMVVPIPPGVTGDVLPRIVAEKLTTRWGHPVIVENRPGAGLNLGAELVATSAPDGYTLLATPAGPLVVSQSFFPKLRFDPSAFVPVTVYAAVPYVLVINSKLPISNLKEFIAYAKANPGKINYASSGIGSALHLTVEMLMRAASIHLVHIPYQGVAPALTDLLSGQVDMMVDNLGNSLPLVKDGRLRALGVASEARISELPDVPAIAEQFPGFYSTAWLGVVAPPKTPTDIAWKLSRAIADIATSPDVAKRFRALSHSPVTMTPDEMRLFLRGEIDRWRGVITAGGIKPN